MAAEPAGLRAELVAEADRIEEDCTYSAKGHFESARIWGAWNLKLGIPAVILAALAGGSGFSNHPELAGALAIASAAVTAVLTFLKPSERAASHQQAGNAYNALKNQARFFKQIEAASGDSQQSLRDWLREISEARNTLNKSAPEIPRPAFEQARKGIEAGEADYRADRPSVPPATTS